MAQRLRQPGSCRRQPVIRQFNRRQPEKAEVEFRMAALKSLEDHRLLTAGESKAAASASAASRSCPGSTCEYSDSVTLTLL